MCRLLHSHHCFAAGALEKCLNREHWRIYVSRVAWFQKALQKCPFAKNKEAGRIRMLANGTSLPVELGQYQGHFTSGGSDDRMELTLPPVFSPNVVPLS
jgi:hypothetical protein